ncbi:phosphatidylserine/phosphatidylglycerophosphate/cardiolipin synthase family protein [Haloferula chungangensis]|uniref:Phosphatidylserine/phosphatidylglycerophosphate/ cardiolipin synthase family protein n=1 Tax=Haloferula chungangensis TaxID=1048331 RepID=A0ABW2L313_9BACT
MISNLTAMISYCASLTGLEIGLLVVVGLLCLMLRVLTRHQEFRYNQELDGRIDEVLPALAGSTHGWVSAGNSVSFIQDAEYFENVAADIGQARCSVHFETFLWKCGEASEIIVAALIAAARRKVDVRLLADAHGSLGFTTEARKRLEEAGCRVTRHHRWLPRNFGRWNLRDHRKIVVIDGRLAYVGGHCVADQWLKDCDFLPRYRDVTARFTGPVVAAIQSTFLENWNEKTREVFTDDATFPELEETGGAKVHVASMRADGCPSSVQVLHYMAIALAKEKIRIQNPYFLPDSCGVKALVDAVARGVDVRVMTPAVTATDSKVVAYASRHVFGRLLKGGVRIFEYQNTLLHQKIISIDGRWAGIGSSNFDDRSFEINDEITVGIADIDAVTELDEIFEEDLKHCCERHYEEWKLRPAWKRAIDAFLHLFNEQF